LSGWLALPEPGPEAARAWVAEHLADLLVDDGRPSERFRGGQSAADAAIAAYDVTGYAKRRNQFLPESDRGASALSPYIRHGLLDLPRVWAAVDGGPAADVRKFRDELLWQEYARHLYARVGGAIGRPLRAEVRARREEDPPWERGMACVDAAVEELRRDGWVPNQARMWLASQWSLRAGRDWRTGERAMFAALLDGSAAANGLGWQWVSGTATGRTYAFTRRNVERRAPGLCATCPLDGACPIRSGPPEPSIIPVPEPPGLRRDPDPGATAGPVAVERIGAPEAVWLTAGSLGDDDPALAANPSLPARFVLDERLLRRFRLRGPRLCFLLETLADLATRRDVRVRVGDPVAALEGLRLAATYTPVPGWRARRRRLNVVEVHPWPWLRRPSGGSVRSFSAWVRG